MINNILSLFLSHWQSSIVWVSCLLTPEYLKLMVFPFFWHWVYLDIWIRLFGFLDRKDLKLFGYSVFRLWSYSILTVCTELDLYIIFIVKQVGYHCLFFLSNIEFQWYWNHEHWDVKFVNFIIPTCLFVSCRNMIRSHVLYNIIENDKQYTFSIFVSLTVINCMGRYIGKIYILPIHVFTVDIYCFWYQN
jgi:hypothetical protein